MTDTKMKAGFSLPKYIRGRELYYISKAMHEAGNNKAEAARLLGLKRTTLVMKMKVCNMPQSVYMPDPESKEFLNLAEYSHQYTWEELERHLIEHTLATYKGNRTHAARALGISIRTIRNKIKQYATEKK